MIGMVKQLAQAMRMCKLYVLFTAGRTRAWTRGGLRRTWVGRELTWPSFIIWRWAGPALAGWTRYRWKARHRPLPPLRLRPMMISVSLRWDGAAVLRRVDRPRSRAESRPPDVPPRKLRARAPENQPRNPPRRAAGRLPGSGAGVPPGRVPAVAHLPERRAPAGRRPGRAPRRDVGAGAAGGNARQDPFSTRARAAAQLISAMWVKAWGKLPRNSPVRGSISSE
jgi:hypothetical protein